PDFTTVTRAYTATEGIGSVDAIAALIPELLDRAVPKSASVRLLGITVSGLVDVPEASQVAHQLCLLDEILNPR
ncbi:DNA polymerase IV, partial [Acidithiobacillus caldus]|nr:DNA polymerase IV [Acidithiobacillus caldus]